MLIGSGLKPGQDAVSIDAGQHMDWANSVHTVGFYHFSTLSYFQFRHCLALVVLHMKVWQILADYHHAVQHSLVCR